MLQRWVRPSSRPPRPADPSFQCRPWRKRRDAGRSSQRQSDQELGVAVGRGVWCERFVCDESPSPSTAKWTRQGNRSAQVPPGCMRCRRGWTAALILGVVCDGGPSSWSRLSVEVRVSQRQVMGEGDRARVRTLPGRQPSRVRCRAGDVQRGGGCGRKMQATTQTRTPDADADRMSSDSKAWAENEGGSR